MRAFSHLVVNLNDAARPNEQEAAIAGYFETADAADAAWALALLSGRRPLRSVRPRDLRAWGMEASGLPTWLAEEAADASGDTCEAVALLLPDGRRGSSASLHDMIAHRLLPLRHVSARSRRERLLAIWSELDYRQRYVCNRIVTGGLRAGNSLKHLIRALSRVSGVAEEVLTLRLNRAWEPTPNDYALLLSRDTRDADRERPYPFCLARSLHGDPQALGPLEQWRVEWMWSGVRAQVIHRGGRAVVWSSRGALLSSRFPEVRDSARTLPDGTALDGVIVAFDDGDILPYGCLQPRLKRSNPSPTLLREAPAAFVAFDALQTDGRDLRSLPLDARRRRLEELLNANRLRIVGAPSADAATWAEVAALHADRRDLACKGLMLKRRDAPYAGGGDPSAWWKWKIDPYTIDGVLVYAEERASGTVFTVGVWSGDELVPCARMELERSAASREDIDAFVRSHVVERYGPVQAVAPGLVVEIGFERVVRDKRRKAGVAVHRPRILRVRHDVDAADAGRLAALHHILRIGY